MSELAISPFTILTCTLAMVSTLLYVNVYRHAHICFNRLAGWLHLSVCAHHMHLHTRFLGGSSFSSFLWFRYLALYFGQIQQGYIILWYGNQLIWWLLSTYWYPAYRFSVWSLSVFRIQPTKFFCISLLGELPYLLLPRAIS